jgi:hypothetical protein
LVVELFFNSINPTRSLERFVVPFVSEFANLNFMPTNNFRNITTTGFDEDALTTFLPNDDIRNFATLTTSGDLANGIFVGADSVSVANFGHVETSGSGAEGVLIQGADGHVRNFGSIVTHGEPTNDFLHFNDAIAAYGNNFDLQSWGSLETHGSFSSGMSGIGDGGVLNFGSISTSGFASQALGAFGNDFHIDNWGVLKTEGDFSGAMLAVGDGGQIRKFGHITTSGFDSQGLVAVGDSNHLVNYGAITVDDPFGIAPGMDAEGSHNEVVNFGTITGAGGIFSGGATVLSGFGNTATNWGTISVDGVAFAMTGTGTDALVQNFGTIEAPEGGILAVGDIGAQAQNTGTITTHGDGFLVDTGADGKAVNGGTILTDESGAPGIDFTSVLGGEITNSGSIETFGGVSDVAASGVAAFGLDVVVHNTRTGSIETHNPNSPAVRLNDHDVDASFFRPGIIAADTHAFLENDGVISAAQTAVLGGAGDETVINHGRIVGNVFLGDGPDTFVFAKGGSLTGDLFLGGGNDFVRIEKGGGTAHIADFAAGDVIDVSAFFSSFSDLQSHSSQQGNDVVINLGHNNELVLENVHLIGLNAGEFIV